MDHNSRHLDPGDLLASGAIMCMTLLLSEPMTHAIVGGGCHMEWSNFTECVVTYVVTRTKMRFSGVISTAVLHYVQVRPETRMSVYVPQLCLGLLVMMVNGWLLVSLQGGTPHRRRAIARLIFSLTAAYCLHGAITVYIMTSLVASSLSANPLLRNQAMECIAANGFLMTAISSALLHHVAIAIDRLQNIRAAASHRMFWTSSRTWLLIGALWAVSMIIGFLPLVGWRDAFKYCIFFYQYYKGYFMLLSGLFLATVSAVAAVHSYVVLATRKPNGATFDIKSNRTRYRRDSRLTATVAILAVVGILFWTPLFLYLVLACPQCLARSDNDFILLGVFALALTNALLSPLIYAFRVKQLRHVVGAVIERWGLCKMKKRSGTFELRASPSNGTNLNHHNCTNRANVLPSTPPQRITYHSEPSTVIPETSRNGDMLY